MLSFQVTNYLQEIAPDLCDRVELHDKRIPLFDEYNIEDEINNLLSKRQGYLILLMLHFLLKICLKNTLFDLLMDLLYKILPSL